MNARSKTKQLSKPRILTTLSPIRSASIVNTVTSNVEPPTPNVTLAPYICVLCGGMSHSQTLQGEQNYNESIVTTVSKWFVLSLTKDIKAVLNKDKSRWQFQLSLAPWFEARPLCLIPLVNFLEFEYGISSNVHEIWRDLSPRWQEDLG